MSDVASEMAEIIRSAGIVFIGKISGKGSKFIAQILIANALLPEEFGILGLAFTVVSIIGTIALMGIPKAVPRQMSAEDQDPQKVLTAGFFISIVLGTVASAAVFLFPTTVAGIFATPDIANLLRPFALYLLCFPLAQISISGLRGYKESKTATLAREIIGPIVPVFIFVAIDAAGYPLIGAVIYYIAIQFLVGIVATVFIIRHFKTPFRQSGVRFSDIKDLISFGWPLAISANLILLMTNLDVLMIGYFLGPEPVGHYKIAQPLGQLVLLPLTAFAFLYLPIVTQYYDAGQMDFLGEVFSATTKWISLCTFPVVLVLALFPESIILSFYRAEYLPGAAALAVYSVGMFSRVFVGPNGAMVEAIGRTRIDLISAILGVFANIILNVVLIPPYGIVGAAVATGIGFFVYNLSEVVAIYYLIGVHPFSFNTLKPMLLTTVLAIIIRRFVFVDRIEFFGLIVAGILISLIELIAIVLTRSISDQDMVLYNHVIRRLG
ncbi:flippase [Haloarcula marina]|uniref:flippase n=1 Tax=Haloarcula marina TaxID=2961574 RepID=UPI0020B77764|nr:flippase [Halomicroarcula marina]